ncbi:MAG: UbiX family flavin prenyltransferase [Actinomycetia bacterium]|nr:UbiX family flavin prenyltransferase [Actinomycetes bacterium]MCH9709245.1 UbiX family flavin prenyltransferase [Actinomycetes bacterium]MCH9766799.1 UbiX family flavin prenyltransferase [Actinomycetes bacterium]
MKRIIVAITGASGATYGTRALELLRRADDVESHLIVTASGQRTIAHETDYSPDEVRGMADYIHNARDIGASVSSGSFVVSGMLIAPCSVKTLSGIANSYNDELVVRAADVCLKERRRVVLLLRETPLHAGHIELMARATTNGAIIMPPVPAFYAMPRTLDEVVDQTVSRALELLDVVVPGIQRWDGKSVTPDGS